MLPGLLELLHSTILSLVIGHFLPFDVLWMSFSHFNSLIRFLSLVAMFLNNLFGKSKLKKRKWSMIIDKKKHFFSLQTETGPILDFQFEK